MTVLTTPSPRDPPARTYTAPFLQMSLLLKFHTKTIRYILKRKQFRALINQAANSSDSVAVAQRLKTWNTEQQAAVSFFFSTKKKNLHKISARSEEPSHQLNPKYSTAALPLNSSSFDTRQKSQLSEEKDAKYLRAPSDYSIPEERALRFGGDSGKCARKSVLVLPPYDHPTRRTPTGRRKLCTNNTPLRPDTNVSNDGGSVEGTATGMLRRRRKKHGARIFFFSSHSGSQRDREFLRDRPTSSKESSDNYTTTVHLGGLVRARGRLFI